MSLKLELNNDYWKLSGEYIKFHTEGQVEGKNYTIVCTNKTLCISRKPKLRGTIQRKYNLSDVKSVVETGFWIFKSITVNFGYYEIHISCIFSEDLQVLKNTIKNSVKELKDKKRASN